MIEWSHLYYFFIGGAALLSSLLGLWFSSFFPGTNSWNKRFFQNFFWILILGSIFGIIEMFVYYTRPPVAAANFVMVTETLLQSMPEPMLAVYLMHCCGENLRTSKFLRAVFVMWAGFVILTICSPFIDGFYQITPDMQYIRGPLYPLLVLPLAGILLFILADTIKRRTQLSQKVFQSLLIALLPMTVTLLILTFIEVYVLIDLSFVISALAMYSLALYDQMEQDLRREQEITRQQRDIANQRASIMVLQMRPHFIYNTMTSIYSLCGQDPKLARQVTLDFTTYLRKNFTAIASPEPIPFSSELEHVHAYLAVEQAQYEDSLFVDYDTPHTRFRVPPLTLQPLVENAVKHGRDPYAGPFHISIRTRKTDKGSEIVVADDGRGFDERDDSEPHIAIKNIRQRLEMMCGGSLAITPNEGGGTVVTVTIPDAAEE